MKTGGAPGGAVCIMSIVKSKRLGWFLPLRLVTFVILFSVIVLLMGYPGHLQLGFVLYAMFTLGFALVLVLDKRSKLRRLTLVLIAFQFLLEILLESGVMYSSGTAASSFVALYLLTIVSAALTFRLTGTLIVASLASLAYTVVIWLGVESGGNPGLTIQDLRVLVLPTDAVLNSAFLHILIFYVVAFISGYLAERLETQDRQLADTHLALRKARLETDHILRHLHSGLLTIDAAANIIYFNRAAERILGYREEDVKGMCCSHAFAERMPELATHLLKCLHSRTDQPRLEVDVRNCSGLTIPLGLSASVLTEDGQAVRGVVAIFSDLTQAKSLEAKARAADRLAAIGELSASIAHEIRNPLTAIAGSVEVLHRELDLSDANDQLMKLVMKESSRLNRILSEFLAYARIDRPAYNKVELCRTIAEVIEMLHHHGSYHDLIDVRFEADESVVYVVGDEGLLKQLLYNLAVNACEAIDTNAGSISFRVCLDVTTNVARLEVTDTGPGIPSEHLRRVYQPFFSTKKSGTGLGLAIVHRICQALKLGIAIDSPDRGGTRFVIEVARYGHFRSFEQPEVASAEVI
jgi:two-component system sensor histidine kinase PilS (NtrC family)